MKRFAPLLVLLLAGCGSATSVDVPTTVAPLSALPTAGESSTAPSSAAPTSNAAQASADPAAPSTPQADPSKDETREVSEIPTPTAAYSEKDKAYFAELEKGGIKVEGTEPQLLGIAQDVCVAKQGGQQSYLVDAIGGQLAEQGYTQLSAEDAGRLIAAAAEHAYC